MAGRLGWGRVVVDEQIYGYRESSASATAADIALQPVLTARWAAPACWFDVGIGDPGGPAAQVLGQFAGWSLAAALQLRTSASFTEVVPCYDHEAHRLYLVDAQPGGSGLAAWIYAHAEELLPLAYDVALACRSDPLLEPMSRADQDWLLALLGRSIEPQPAARPRAPEPASRQPARAAHAARADRGPPPATPRVILTPAPPEHSPPARPSERPDDSPSPCRAHRSSARRMAGPARHRQQRPGPPRLHPGRATKGSGRRWRPAAEPAPASRPRRATAAPIEPARAAARRAPAHATARTGAPTQAPGRAEPQRPAPQGAALGAAHARASQRAASRGCAARPGGPDRTGCGASASSASETRDASNIRSAQSPRRSGEVELRFAAGDRIFCLPYGDGTVQESRAEGGREVLLVNFPNHGDLTIDPAVNFVRKQEDAPEDDDLL